KQGYRAGTSVFKADPSGSDRFRLLRPDVRRQSRRRFDEPIGRLGKRPNLLRRYIAGHDKNGVVGSIKALVERYRVLARQLAHFFHPSQRWPAVRMVQV